MKGPKRLIEDESSLGARLLRSAHTDKPREASWRRAMGAAVAASAAATATSTASAVAGGVKTSLLLKWLGMGVVAGGATIWATADLWVEPVHAVQSQEPARAVLSSRTAKSQREELDLAPKMEESVVGTDESRKERVPGKRAGAFLDNVRGDEKPSSSEPTTPSLAEEQRAVEVARLHLQGGNPGKALVALDRYRNAYPKPRFAQEALVIRLEALVQMGRCDQARNIADGFATRHPESALAKRVRSLVQRCR